MSLFSEIRLILVASERINNLAAQVEQLVAKVATKNRYLEQEIKDLRERLIRLEVLSEAGKNRPH